MGGSGLRREHQRPLSVRGPPCALRRTRDRREDTFGLPEKHVAGFGQGSLTLQTGPQLAAYAPSKTMLNSITAQYARRLADTNIIINVACPGYVATGFTGHSGQRTPDQGAAIAIQLATVPDDGPRGSFFNEDGPVAW